MWKRRVLVLLVIFIATGGVVAFADHGASGSDPSSRSEKTGVQSDAQTRAAVSDSNAQVRGLHLLPCTIASQAPNFRFFSLGAELDGLAYGDTLRRCENPDPSRPVRANYVSLAYGDCTPGDDSGCPLPVEIQSWPACERNSASYTDVDGTPLARKPVQISGVPAAIFDDGTRVEVYTGDTTVVVFGSTPALALQAAKSLSIMPGDSPADARPTGGTVTAQLAPPVDGAMTGTLTCNG